MYHRDVAGAGDDGYRLHALRRIREQQESERKQALADAIAATAAARQEVARRQQAVRDARATLADAIAREAAGDGPVSAHALVASRRYRARLEAEIEALEQRVAEAEQIVAAREQAEEEARTALADAARERMAVDKHYEQYRRQRARDRARKEEDAADDIAQRRKP